MVSFSWCLVLGFIELQEYMNLCFSSSMGTISHYPNITFPLPSRNLVTYILDCLMISHLKALFIFSVFSQHSAICEGCTLCLIISPAAQVGELTSLFSVSAQGLTPELSLIFLRAFRRCLLYFNSSLLFNAHVFECHWLLYWGFNLEVMCESNYTIQSRDFWCCQGHSSMLKISVISMISAGFCLLWHDRVARYEVFSPHLSFFHCLCFMKSVEVKGI